MIIDIKDISNIEIHGQDNKEPTHAHIEMLYPEIYESEKSTITIGLCHIRAADDIRISCDSERDGWVIEQATQFEWEGDQEPDPHWKEAAFIPAWQFEEHENEEGL